MPVKKAKPIPLKKKKKKIVRKKAPRRFLKKILTSFLVLFIAGIMILAAVLYYYSTTLPTITSLDTKKHTPMITILSKNKEILATYGDSYGAVLRYKDIPEHLVHALLATEDRRFFDHHGLDFFGILRASWVNYRAGRILQGGSTLTQQLAKILFLTSERTFSRKIQESLLAFQLERSYSKQELIALYLNKVYFGGGNYGIDAASSYFLGKPAQKLELGESALLIGLLKAPTNYNPLHHPEKAKERARQVLQNMVEAGYVKASHIAYMKDYNLMNHGSRRGILHNPYFTDYVIEILPDYVKNIQGDITIVTTLDAGLQQKIETIIRDMSLYDAQKNITQLALITMEPSGAIRSMVGGRDYAKSQFNRATKAKRHYGSAFKIFVYLAALEAGYNNDSVVFDGPITVDGWTPENFTKAYHGSISLQEAFVRSLNTVAVQLSEKIGRKKIRLLAKRLGVESALTPHASMALGTSEMTLLEMTQAYGVIANQGRKCSGFAIEKIYDSKNKILYQHPHTTQHPVLISDETNASMTELLYQVIESPYGTGKKAKLPSREAAGKSGTSQDFRDAVFIGFTPELITGIWLGNDDNSPMVHVTGGSLPAVLWNKVMTYALQNKPPSLLHRKRNKPISSSTQEKPASFLEELIKNFSSPSRILHTYPGHGE